MPSRRITACDGWLSVWLTSMICSSPPANPCASTARAASVA